MLGTRAPARCVGGRKRLFRVYRPRPRNHPCQYGHSTRSGTEEKRRRRSEQPNVATPSIISRMPGCRARLRKDTDVPVSLDHVAIFGPRAGARPCACRSRPLPQGCGPHRRPPRTDHPKPGGGAGRCHVTLQPRLPSAGNARHDREVRLVGQPRIRQALLRIEPGIRRPQLYGPPAIG
jgi:hypothetical protein